MVWATPGVRVGRPIVRQADVPHLGVDKAMQELPIHHDSSADAGADGQIDEGIQPLGRAPAPLPQRRAVHVGIKADRHAQHPGHRPGEVGVGPARLGRGGDIAVGWGLGIGVQRPKGGNANGRQRATVGLLRLKKGDGPANGLGRGGGGETCFGLDVVPAGAHCAHKLGPPRFNAAHKRFHDHAPAARLFTGPATPRPM